MSEQELDLNAVAKKNINVPNDRYYELGKAASDGGKLKLVSERICQPFNGYAFKLDKGQVIRYEVLDGPLPTASDPMYRTMDPIDFIKAGRPGMVTGVVGKA